MYDIKNLYEPTSVLEALKLRKEHPEALILAGGSDIFIKIREGKLAGCDLISIFALDELRGICIEDDGSILIRPLSSFTDVVMHPIIKNISQYLVKLLNKLGTTD